MVRINKKNEIDMQNMQDLKSLEKLQRGESNIQLNALTETLADDENDREQTEAVD